MKTIITNLLWFPLLLITSFGYGQEGKQPTSLWNISLGYNNTRTLDENASPLVYSANSVAVGAAFRRMNTERICSVSLDAAIGSNQSARFGKRTAVLYGPYSLTGERDSIFYELNPGLSNFQAALNYSMLWKINRHKNPFYLGGGLSEQFRYAAMGADSWFFNQLSITANILWTISIGQKSNVEIAFDTPVFSYLVRQPYTLDPSLPEPSYFIAYLKTGSDVATFDKFQQIRLGITYFYQLRGRHCLGLSYRFTWLNCANIPERNLRVYSNTLSISYKW